MAQRVACDELVAARGMGSSTTDRLPRRADQERGSGRFAWLPDRAYLLLFGQI